MTRNLSGTQLGPYEIQHLLGSGGMAQVYEGYDPRLQRQVAIKVLAEDAIIEAGIAERFRHEARLLATLRHPHVVSAYDLGEQDGYLYMVQELLPGPTLEAWMQERAAKGEAPTRAEILQITDEIASGLDAAHQAGIIHRDVKPANVLWNRTGALVLTDFGIAKQPNRDAGLTQAGIVMGTPAYLSPEQAWGLPLTPASDIYALGVILYELLSGHPPFQGDTPMNTVMQHIQDPLPPLEPQRPEVPYGVSDVVEKALAKEPEARFARATDLSQALHDAWPAVAPAAPDDRATRAWVAPAIPEPAALPPEEDSQPTRAWVAPAIPEPATQSPEGDSQSTRAWAAPETPAAAAAGEDGTATWAAQQAPAAQEATPAASSAPERRPLVLPPPPPRSPWSIGLPIAVGVLMLLAAGWAIQALQNRDVAAGEVALPTLVATEATGAAPLATASQAALAPTSPPEDVPTAISVPTEVLPVLPEGDPLLALQAFLEASHSSGQLGQAGEAILQSLSAAQRHLAAGRTRPAQAQLRDLRATLVQQQNAGQIDAAVAAQALALVDATAQQYGLDLTDKGGSEKDEEKDKDEDKDKGKDD